MRILKGTGHNLWSVPLSSLLLCVLVSYAKPPYLLTRPCVGTLPCTKPPYLLTRPCVDTLPYTKPPYLLTRPCVGTLPCTKPPYLLTRPCVGTLPYAKPPYLLTRPCVGTLPYAKPPYLLTRPCVGTLPCTKPPYLLTRARESLWSRNLSGFPPLWFGRLANRVRPARGFTSGDHSWPSGRAGGRSSEGSL